MQNRIFVQIPAYRERRDRELLPALADLLGASS
jgi:hypothetical protein